MRSHGQNLGSPPPDSMDSSASAALPALRPPGTDDGGGHIIGLGTKTATALRIM